VFQHLEYFPFGETWVEEKSNTQRTPYLFTGKELDEDTGLYYFGARYYDQRTSVWVSVDPIVGQYLPTGNKEKDGKLPGMGGVFSTTNLNLYHYSGLNPIKYIDPDGRTKKVVVLNDSSGAFGNGHNAIAIERTDGKFDYFSKEGPGKPNVHRVISSLDEIKNSEGQPRYDRSITVNDSFNIPDGQVEKMRSYALKHFDEPYGFGKESAKSCGWLCGTHCGDLVRDVLNAGGIDVQQDFFDPLNAPNTQYNRVLKHENEYYDALVKANPNPYILRVNPRNPKDRPSCSSGTCITEW